MDKQFTSNGYRVIDFTLYKSGIRQLRKEWKEYVQRIPPYPGNFSGRGIVMCGGGLTYFTCCWIAIKAIRRTGCELPIELWYIGNELTAELKIALQELNVSCENFLTHIESPRFTFSLKPLAILKSKFREILYIDADNVCVSNPSLLFETSAYIQYGTIFWPDFWTTAPENPIWEIVGSKSYDGKEQEGGQLLINKEKCWKEINLCQYFNKRSEIYYKMLPGNKDTFRFAWLALKTPFYMIDTDVAACGYVHASINAFLGTTMVQHDTTGNICFLHRNLLKWDITRANEFTWKKIKRFTRHAAQKEYVFGNKKVNGHLYLDLKGDVEEQDCNDECNGLEQLCLANLEELRTSGMYANFMIHLHFSYYRYPKNRPFSMSTPMWAPAIS